MKTFLLKNNVPIIKWGSLKDNVYYQGVIPEGYDLAVAPSSEYIIIDVDNKKGKEGSKNLPPELLNELWSSFYYPTKNNGIHIWFKYTGNKILKNTTSNLGIDLRIGPKVFSKTKWSYGGYVKWHPRDTIDPKEAELQAKESSPELNKWLEKLFGSKE